MKVSTITPVYNNGPYLIECIESLLSQTFEDKELIFVDDGSTDHSSDILKQYSNYPQVKVITNDKNEGIAAAYRKAHKIATGDILCFLDADDIATRDRITKTVDLFQKEPSIGFAYSAMELINKKDKPFHLQCQLPSYVNNKRLFFQLFRRNFFTGSALTVRNYHWLKFDLDVICCDYYLSLQLAERGIPYGYIAEPLTKYRIHGKNTSGSSDRMFHSIVKVLSQYHYSALEVRWQEEGYTKAEIFTTFGIMEYYYYKNPHQAMEYFKKATELEPSEVEPYFYLGCLYYQMGMLEDTYIKFQKAYQIAPQCFQVLHNLGVITALLSEDRQESEALLLKAQKIQPYYVLVDKNIQNLRLGQLDQLKMIRVLTDDDNIYLTFCRLQ
jgi:glycosyltransferase involved in cell wall biosynthesis